jgi:hypothetical protein
MVDRVLGEEVADRQAGMAGTDDDRRDVFDGEPPPPVAGSR